MNLRKPPKGYYSAAEAARLLGITIDELRSIVSEHIGAGSEDLKNLGTAELQLSDVVLLRHLSGRNIASQHSD
ncbi:MAG: hypothetical protein LC130_05285 [Bryobacterales bacterium]|nr:hypothetical protein [Bryobacterales bacterium]MEB2361148.1 hypothetical protein [Bryobacterales bacterium]